MSRDDEMSMAATASKGRRRAERMSPAPLKRDLLKLIDRDVTRTGKAREQRMDIEKVSTTVSWRMKNVRMESRCVYMLFVPRLFRLVA